MVSIHIQMSPFFLPDFEAVQAGMIALGNAERGKAKVFIHCKDGVDRTGVLVCCYRVWRMNWAMERAIKEMFDLGFHKIRYAFWLNPLWKMLLKLGGKP
jgi:protein-tyrosine phosphatase